MRYSDLSEWSIRIGRWAAQYHDTLRVRPVRAQTAPGDILREIPAQAPTNPTPVDIVFADFEKLIPDAMTHWQHPRFFAYFPANAAPASILAEQIINTMACNCMLWQTSPAATELEQRMVEWLRGAVGLPDRFTGTIQDSATTATLCALLTMRERSLDWQGLSHGLAGQDIIRIYASPENHSSVIKAARISGIGDANLVQVATDSQLALCPRRLRQAIEQDLAAGMRPAGLVLCAGGTANGAFDRIADTIAVAKEFGLYCHVDAAWAGSAMICPEFRYLWKGAELADSIVINPTKWLGAQFDCSVQLLAEPQLQSTTLSLRPEYLQSGNQNGMMDFQDLTLPLGRRFRALKLWFVFRVYGVSGLQGMIRNHVNWVKALENKLIADPEFEIVTSCPLALFTFRYAPEDGDADSLTTRLLSNINDDGRIYLTPSQFKGRPVIRMTAGTFSCTKSDVMSVYDIIRELASEITSTTDTPQQRSDIQKPL